MGEGAQPYALDRAALRDHLQAQAFLQAGLAIRFVSEPGPVVEEFRYDTGIVGYVSWLDRARDPVHAEPIELKGVVNGTAVHVALQWTHKYNEDLRGFVNRIYTPQGGTHVEGLKAALTEVINEAAEERVPGEEIAGYDVREGLTAIVSVRLRNPEFEGQTKATLTSVAAEEAVERVVGEQLRSWLAANPELAAALVGREQYYKRLKSGKGRGGEAVIMVENVRMYADILNRHERPERLSKLSDKATTGGLSHPLRNNYEPGLPLFTR